ncbi:MAG: response regulator containing a CheY-like receiver domain and an DNA-binding domain [Bacteroidetes bacterium]|jgi:DNA-binding NarL/FixJ family response regulator|nr:response regulator containing a CheY-like receiver domain and an DNA-binding domain [Bacteroidota bacterium]
MKRNVIIFDKQDITRLGVEALVKMSLRHQEYRISFVNDRNELIAVLATNPESLVILDYALSDMNSVDGLLNIAARFHKANWVLFSEDLSIQFLKRIVVSHSTFSVVLKNSEIAEIKEAFLSAYNHTSFVCVQIRNLLEVGGSPIFQESNLLTITEKEILKEIAWGKTAKEIAAARNISVYTVITHRKNIYRKLDVNNSQEASRYALRAGIIDASDYYI